MALIISATQNNKLKLNGTLIELNSIYVRINWSCPITGKNINYSLIPFIDKSMYDLGTAAPIYFEGGSGIAVLDINEIQDLTTIHNKVKENLESLGFEVSIEL